MAEPGEQQSPPFWREGRAALRLVFPSPLVLPIACILTFMASLQFLLEGPGLNSLDVLSARQTRLWHMLVAFEPTLWLASLLSVLGDFKRNGPVWPGPSRERLAVVFYAVFLFTMTLLPTIPPLLVNPSVLPANVDALTELPHLKGNPSSAEETAPESLEREVLRYQQLRAQLKRCLGFVGAIISGSLLTVSAFNNVLAQAAPPKPTCSRP